MKQLKCWLFLLIIAGLTSCGSSSEDAAVFVNTKWQSNEVGYANNHGPNMVVLTFFKDSVHFDVPSHDIILVADILGGIAGGKEIHYSWDYRVDKEEVVLDPGLTGYSLKLKRSGDSLIYMGKPPAPLKSFSFKQVQ
jgi:hypothetical protein